MKSFEFYIEEKQSTVRKLVIKNKSHVTKLLKVTQYDEIIKLLVVKGNTVKEVQINRDDIGFSVTEVID